MFPENTKSLLQGDSITDGLRSRNDDLNHVLGHGYVYLIASKLSAEYPGLNLQFLNRGCSGNQTVNLYARWKEDTINLNPDVLSILVGVNDVGAQFSRNAGIPASQYDTVYRLMLKDAKDSNPNLLFVLCEPFILRVGKLNQNWSTWKSEMAQRRQIVETLASEVNAIFVKTQSIFDKMAKEHNPKYWLWDGIHPMPAGHQLLANSWLSAVEKNKHSYFPPTQLGD